MLVLFLKKSVPSRHKIQLGPTCKNFFRIFNINQKFAGETLHYLRKDSRLLLRADLQQLMVGMVDSGGDERVVYAPPPSYEFMKQDDKVSPLV
jgi:hypothetical protein